MNLCVFIVVNWLQTMILILVYKRLEKIKDELNIQKELRLIIFVWVFFSLSYFAIIQVESNIQDDSGRTVAAIVIFSII